MSALTLTLKKSLQFSINCAALTPNYLAGKTAAEIAAIQLNYGNTQLRLDEVFEIAGDDTQHIHIKNSSEKLEYLGGNMTAGKLTIDGDAGAYLGFGLRLGSIHCHGNSAAFAACNMVSGFIQIDGNTGDFLGSASAGLRKGMRGGTVIVKGNAGDRAGDQMRRGLILIEGNAGDYCASRMVAGTIGVLGKVGAYAGYSMRRGTLLLTQQPSLHITMQDCGMHTLPFLSLLYKSFAQYGNAFSQLKSQRVQRFVGDAGNSGNGEILVIQAI